MLYGAMHWDIGCPGSSGSCSLVRRLMQFRGLRGCLVAYVFGCCGSLKHAIGSRRRLLVAYVDRVKCEVLGFSGYAAALQSEEAWILGRAPNGCGYTERPARAN
ncbi:hypothetical protein UA74_15900 [Actinoalloteichus fjordicus]|uniref:Uncharacterized protein n=1 Tax=Actinoalloteichus fjordicus TaxID=1612552 RepID=A0AAC9PSP5_9PSEU|nr:hypothetical protein UA74_15900 [Actinoalloteichus fjordicus]